MQAPQPDPKSSSLVVPPHAHRWYCPWLPDDRAVQDIHQVQSDYRRRIVRLMLAALVFYATSAIHLLPDDCQASFRFIPASKALSLAGLLTQLAFYRGIPSHVEAFSLAKIEENRSRAIVLFASLWLPFVPFVLSIVLLGFGTHHGACIPTGWQAPAGVP